MICFPCGIGHGGSNHIFSHFDTALLRPALAVRPLESLRIAYWYLDSLFLEMHLRLVQSLRRQAELFALMLYIFFEVADSHYVSASD